MKKTSLTLLTLVVIIIALVFVLPYAMGYFVEKRVPTILQALSSSKVNLQLENYQRGWFNSTANIKVTVGPGHKTFEMVESITHGPFFFTTTSEGNKRFAVGQAAFQMQNIQGMNFTANAVVGLNGKVIGFVRSSQFIVTTPQGVNVMYSNLEIVFTISPDIQHIQGYAEFAGAQIQMQNLQAILQNVKINFNLQRGSSGLWLRDQLLSVQSVVLSVGQPNQRITLNGFNQQFTTREVNGRLNAILITSLQSVDTPTLQTGPYYLNLAINDLDILSLQKLIEFFQENDPISQQFSHFQKQQLAAMFLDLIGKGMNLVIHQLSVITPKGTIAAKANITLPTQQNGGGLMLALTNAKADLTIEGPEPLLSDALKIYFIKYQMQHPDIQIDPIELSDQQIQQWIKTGWIVQDGNQLQLILNYQKGQLLINGRDQKTLSSPTLSLPSQAPTTNVESSEKSLKNPDKKE